MKRGDYNFQNGIFLQTEIGWTSVFWRHGQVIVYMYMYNGVVEVCGWVITSYKMCDIISMHQIKSIYVSEWSIRSLMIGSDSNQI